MNAGVYLDEWLQSEGWYCRYGGVRRGEGGEEGKNGPFSRLIDLLPRHPIVVVARNENVTLYRLES